MCAPIYFPVVWLCIQMDQISGINYLQFVFISYKIIEFHLLLFSNYPSLYVFKALFHILLLHFSTSHHFVYRSLQDNGICPVSLSTIEQCIDGVASKLQLFLIGINDCFNIQRFTKSCLYRQYMELRSCKMYSTFSVKIILVVKTAL